MRRSALVARDQGKRPAERAWRSSQRLVGHALLMAHNPAAYNVILREWERDIRIAIGYPRDYSWLTLKDEFGALQPGRPLRPPTSQGKFHVDVWRALQKRNIPPTYRKVLEAHLAPAIATERKKHKKLLAQTVESQLGVFVHDIRTILHDITPTAIQRMAPPIETLPTLSGFAVTDLYVEAFIWRSNGMPSPEGLGPLFAACPYGVCLSLDTFAFKMRDPVYEQSLKDIDYRTLAARALSLSAWYIVLLYGIKAGKRMPVISEVINLWEIWILDLPRIYAFTTTLHWHATGKQSGIISGLIPKDPYAAHKRFAAVLSAAMPLRGLELVPFELLLDAGPRALELVVTVLAARHGQLMDGPRSLTGVNPWIKEIGDNADGTMALISPTASGKSTLFASAYIRTRRANGLASRLWVSCPTRALALNYHNHYWPHEDTRILKTRDTPSHGTSLVIGTHGRVAVRLARNEVSKGDSLLIDEAHLLSLETLSLARRWPGPVIHATATPKIRAYGKIDRYLGGGFRPRFTVTRLRGAGSEADLVAQLLRVAGPIKRGLVIVETERKLPALVSTLGAMGLEATMMSASMPIIPKTGWIVATTIFDVGLDAEPPVDAVVSCGLMRVRTEAGLRTIPSTLEIETQRSGRTGRAGPGYYITTMTAGTSVIDSLTFGLPEYCKHFKTLPEYQGDVITWTTGNVAELRGISRPDWDTITTVPHKENVLTVFTMICGGMTQHDAIATYAKWYYRDEKTIESLTWLPERHPDDTLPLDIAMKYLNAPWILHTRHGDLPVTSAYYAAGAWCWTV